MKTKYELIQELKVLRVHYPEALKTIEKQQQEIEHLTKWRDEAAKTHDEIYERVRRQADEKEARLRTLVIAFSRCAAHHDLDYDEDDFEHLD